MEMMRPDLSPLSEGDSAPERRPLYECPTRTQYVGYTMLMVRDRDTLIAEQHLVGRFYLTTGDDSHRHAVAVYAAMTRLADSLDLALTEPVVDVQPCRGGATLVVTAGIIDRRA